MTAHISNRLRRLYSPTHKVEDFPTFVSKADQEAYWKSLDTACDRQAADTLRRCLSPQTSTPPLRKQSPNSLSALWFRELHDQSAPTTTTPVLRLHLTDKKQTSPFDIVGTKWNLEVYDAEALKQPLTAHYSNGRLDFYTCSLPSLSALKPAYQHKYLGDLSASATAPLDTGIAKTSEDCPLWVKMPRTVQENT